MSYILDALKKLEQEKARKTKTPGSIAIAGELFSEKSPVKRTTNGRMVGVAILAAVVMTFGVSWFLFKGKRNVDTASVRTIPVQASPAVAGIPATPANQVLAQQPAESPVQPVVQTQPYQAAAPQPVAQKQQQQAAVAVSEEDDEQPSPRRTRRQPAVLQVQQKAAHSSGGSKSVQALAPAPADIQVSGVAWQDERGLRRAVVNGLLMKEGTSIAGAQLKEILPDRVRFERSGTVFEVPFVSSSLPAGK